MTLLRLVYQFCWSIMKTHELKTVNPHFQDLIDDKKTFELRLNDRDYQVNDILILKEYDYITDTYSNRYVKAVVTHILSYVDFPEGIKEGYVIMSVKRFK